MPLVSFGREHVPDAAALFVDSLEALRQDVSALSGADRIGAAPEWAHGAVGVDRVAVSRAPSRDRG
jgi:hypothetical protein